MEVFSKPAVGGIIEKQIDDKWYVLIQTRCKKDAPQETGLVEIPAGKIREFENIFDALRREIWEETGLEVTKIHGENEAVTYEQNGYRVISYEPFYCSQNIIGNYPIMVQTFICEAKGTLLEQSNESKNIRWIELMNLKKLTQQSKDEIYPMHFVPLKKYLAYKGY